MYIILKQYFIHRNCRIALVFKKTTAFLTCVNLHVRKRNPLRSSVQKYDFNQPTNFNNILIGEFHVCMINVCGIRKC